jgi:predicted dehydrogenase
MTDLNSHKKPIENRLRVGVVGVGYLGKFHAQKYANMDDVDLVGVVDCDQKQAEAVAADLRTRAFYNHKDLLGQIDAVSIAAPTPLHFDLSLDYLKNDVDVLIEKPITTTLKEADTLISMAEKKGLIIQVGHLERFNPAVVALKEILTVPMFIESHRLSLFQPRGTDVSVVHDLMIHDIDIILNLVKSDVVRLDAAGTAVVTPYVDIANARLQFASGCVANITASRLALKNKRKIRIFQRDAYISVDFANKSIAEIRKGNGESDGIIPGTAVKTYNFDPGDALDDELKAFVLAVKKRRTPEVTGQMGRDALKIALSIVDQITTGSV